VGTVFEGAWVFEGAVGVKGAVGVQGGFEAFFATTCKKLGYKSAFLGSGARDSR
jgi:hypothetical protein